MLENPIHASNTRDIIISIKNTIVIIKVNNRFQDKKIKINSKEVWIMYRNNENVL